MCAACAVSYILSRKLRSESLFGGVRNAAVFPGSSSILDAGNLMYPGIPQKKKGLGRYRDGAAALPYGCAVALSLYPLGSRQIPCPEAVTLCEPSLIHIWCCV